MKKALFILLIFLCGCAHDRASWRVYVPFATTSKAGTEKAGGIQGCGKGVIPAALCNK